MPTRFERAARQKSYFYDIFRRGIRPRAERFAKKSRRNLSAKLRRIFPVFSLSFFTEVGPRFEIQFQQWHHQGSGGRERKPFSGWDEPRRERTSLSRNVPFFRTQIRLGSRAAEGEKRIKNSTVFDTLRATQAGMEARQL